MFIDCILNSLNKSLRKLIKKAIKLYKKRDLWDELRKRVMKDDFSWDVSSEKYLEIYQKVIEGNTNPDI